MAAELLSEIIPLSAEDCFLVMQRTKQEFSFPIHVHPEFELNYLENAAGAIRVVGDSVEQIHALDLVLIGSSAKHGYINHVCMNRDIQEITIQFHPDLFHGMLSKRHFKSIKEMFDKAAHGLVFSNEAILKLRPVLKSLSEEGKDSFANLLLLFNLLKQLSLDEKARALNAIQTKPVISCNPENERLERIMLYLHENYHRSLSLSQLAEFINMSEVSLNRFLKKWTNKSFIHILNDIRVNESVCLLIDTTSTISEICFRCGFNNISNFNRIFKGRKGCTPSKYREYYFNSRYKL